MVVDSGNAGLEQSVHHPLAGTSMHATQRDSSEEGGREIEGPYKDLLKPFKDFVIPGKEVEFIEKLREVLATRRRDASATQASTDVELKNLRGTVEALAKTIEIALPRLQGNQTNNNNNKQSWASVAAGGTQSGSERAAHAPKVVIPERRTREVVIRAPGQNDDLAKRTPVQVVEAVNKAIGTDSVVAARRMPSGDTILTFNDSAEGYTKQTKWVEAAFGTKAEVKRREFAVVAKGLPAGRLRGIHDPTALLEELRKRTPGIARCRIHLPKTSHGRFAEVTLHMGSIAAAQEACRMGVIFEAQIFNVEPYYADAQVRRCFRCHAFGHIGRYCTRPARCGHCAATAHEDGETNCPELADSGKKRCINCDGAHVAWDRSCPTAQKELERAHQAYLHRPLQFEVTQGSSFTDSAPTPTPIPQPGVDSEGFRVVTHKRQTRTASQQRAPSQPAAKRGRPSGLVQAARACQDIVMYASQGSSIEVPGTQSSQRTSSSLDPFI
jgi:hypothetical protein